MSSIGSVNSSGPAGVQAIVRQPAAQNAQRGGADKDGDADNSAASAPTPPQPTVNSSGQILGALLNVKA